ncbi:hypothetical protein [Marinimicrobium locisalis]|uniref:hypothetical protein n=1 Tax=Marinimicrobium locisalis TaxID=546022 RepID=UPI003221F4B7
MWLKQALEQNAEELNHRVRLARFHSPRFSASAFSGFLAQWLDSLCESLADWPAEKQEQLLEVGFETGLILEQHGRLQGAAAEPYRRLFERVLPVWLSLHPEAVACISALLNTLFKLPGDERRAHFLDDWQALRPEPSQCESFLLVLAWRHGLVEYREAALSILSSVDIETFGLHQPERITSPWWHAWDGRWQEAPQRLGAHKLLNGDFESQPTLGLANGTAVIQAGRDQWYLYADAYGTRLLPLGKTVVLEGVSARVARELRQAIPADLADPCQHLRTESLDLITFKNSYQVLLLPRQGAEQ